jgi:hypothetical protein
MPYTKVQQSKLFESNILKINNDATKFKKWILKEIEIKDDFSSSQIDLNSNS